MDEVIQTLQDQADLTTVCQETELSATSTDLATASRKHNVKIASRNLDFDTGNPRRRYSNMIRSYTYDPHLCRSQPIPLKVGRSLLYAAQKGQGDIKEVLKDNGGDLWENSAWA